MNSYSVYIHICPNNKVYIGITSQKPEYRWDNGKGYKNNDHFYKAIQKYGWENIEHKILYTGLAKVEAEQKEIDLIAKYDSTNREKGYNNENGGNCVGKMSLRSKNKLSKSVKNLWKNEEYRKKQKNKTPGMLGKSHTEETKQKMSEKAKKRKITDKELYRLKTMNIGRKMSDEAKQKISKALKGRKLSEKTKKKLSEQRKGKPTWIKGQKLSEKHKKNISKGLCKKVYCFETNKIYDSIKVVQKELKVNNVSNVCNGKQEQSKGLHFKFVN